MNDTLFVPVSKQKVKITEVFESALETPTWAFIGNVVEITYAMPSSSRPGYIAVSACSALDGVPGAAFIKCEPYEEGNQEASVWGIPAPPDVVEPTRCGDCYAPAKLDGHGCCVYCTQRRNLSYIEQTQDSNNKDSLSVERKEIRAPWDWEPPEDY